MKILCIITGSVAVSRCYEILEKLKKHKVDVDCVLTTNAKKLVSISKLRNNITGKIYTDISENKQKMLHINLSRKNDIIAVCPATANTIAKFANGYGDNLASTILLASNKPIYLIPAMNTEMWENKINKKNIDYNWISFFDDLTEEAAELLEGNSNHIISNKGQSSNNNSQDNEYTANSLRARLLIRAYRIAGHLKADLDPLELTEQKYIPDLDPKTYGIDDNDMDKQVFIIIDDSDETDEPIMNSLPELKYALETILDNADGFARQQITITISWNKADLIITIQDDGAGFTRAILNRFGQPFNSTRKGQSGHKGLGLYLSMSLIETMGGQMNVKNTQDGGGYVAITLPRPYIEDRRGL